MAKFKAAPKLQPGQFGGDTINQVNKMAYEIGNVHFVQRA